MAQCQQQTCHNILTLMLSMIFIFSHSYSTPLWNEMHPIFDVDEWMDLIQSLTNEKFFENTGTGKNNTTKTKWKKSISVESLVKYTV